jgi:hypothetical protein
MPSRSGQAHAAQQSGSVNVSSWSQGEEAALTDVGNHRMPLKNALDG